MVKRSAVFLLVLVLYSCGNSSREDIAIADNQAEKGNLVGAIEILNKVLKKDPQNIDALINRGFYYTKQNRFENAMNDLSAVIRLDPKNTTAFYNRSYLYALSEEKEKELNDLNSAIATKGNEIVWVDNPKRAYDIPMVDLRYERGIVSYEMKDWKTAFDDFNFCIGSLYELSECYYYRGIIYLNYKHTEKGCADLKMAESLGNEDADTLIKMYCN